jgi:hypothetical protein
MRKALCAALCVLGLLGVFACSANATSGVHVVHARAPGANCDYSDDTVYIEHDLLDLGQATSIDEFFSWENTLQASTIVVNGDTIQDSTIHTFFASQVEYTYSSSRGSVSVPGATYDVYAALAAGAPSSQNDIMVPMFPPPADAALASAIAPGDLTGAVVSVTFWINGTVGGSSTSTNKTTFPVTVVNSGIPVGGTCTVAGVSFPAAPGRCAPGQESISCQFLPDGGVP